MASGRVALQPGADLESVDDRHGHVQHDDVGFLQVDLVQGLFAVAGGQRLIAVVFQPFLDQREDFLVVVHNENGAHPRLLGRWDIRISGPRPRNGRTGDRIEGCPPEGDCPLPLFATSVTHGWGNANSGEQVFMAFVETLPAGLRTEGDSPLQGDRPSNSGRHFPCPRPGLSRSDRPGIPLLN